MDEQLPLDFGLAVIDRSDSRISIHRSFKEGRYKDIRFHIQDLRLWNEAYHVTNKGDTWDVTMVRRTAKLTFRAYPSESDFAFKLELVLTRLNEIKEKDPQQEDNIGNQLSKTGLRTFCILTSKDMPSVETFLGFQDTVLEFIELEIFPSGSNINRSRLNEKTGKWEAFENP